MQKQKSKVKSDKAKFFLYIAVVFILISAESACWAQQTYPWETALDTQLNQLKEKYGDIPQDIIVVHLGITDRDEQAYQIAKSLSEVLGRPVIALPSYSGEPKQDLRKTVAQYCNSRTYPVRFEKAWEKILSDNYRIVDMVVHSGAGLRFNTERKDAITFIRGHQGEISGNIVFVDTDLKGLTQKDFKAVGMSCTQIGKVPAVAWVTKPAERYIPFGEYIGPPATFLGWPLKTVAAVPAAIDAARGFPDHPLSRRIDKIKTALSLPTTISTPVTVGKTEVLETGGIDFSSINLRYLSEYQDKGLYVMGAAFLAFPSEQNQGVDLQRASELSWNSFYTCLALPSSAFWVNLNPSEPDRIVDREVGKTDVGRILLEADLQMKKDIARLTHPKDSQLGIEFWDKIYQHIIGNRPMSGSMQIAIPVAFRVWIVPGQVVVWATDESIYIVDAQMDVKLESEYFSQTSGVIPAAYFQQSPGTSTTQKYAEGLLKEMILPALVKEVKTGPQYQELRQVFYSRIIAEWYKTKHHSRKQAFGKIVGQGNTNQWRSSEVWSAREIFERYKQSLSKGEYSLTEESETTNGTFIIKMIRQYFTGGVDFMKIPMTEISYEQLLSQKPQVPEQLFDALLTPTGHWNDEVWIGGIYVGGIPEFRSFDDKASGNGEEKAPPEKEPQQEHGHAGPNAANAPSSREMQLEAAETIQLGATNAPTKNVTLGSTDPRSGFKFELELASKGAAIKKAAFSEFDDRNYKNPQPLAILSPVKLADGSEILPMANREFVFVQEKLQLSLQDLHFKSFGKETAEDGSQTARFEAVIKTSDGEPIAKLLKTYKVSPGSCLLDCDITVENLSDAEQKVRFNLTGPAGIGQEDISRDDKKVVAGFRNLQGRITTARLDAKKLSRAKNFDGRRLTKAGADFLWVATVNKYFAAILVPVPDEGKEYCDWVKDKAGWYYNPDGDTSGNSGDETIGTELATTPTPLAPAGQAGCDKHYKFQLYLGPKDKSLFDKNDMYRNLGFVQTIDFLACCCPASIISPLAFGILAIMKWMYGFIANYGVVIIILVFLMRLVMHPITKKSQVSMSKMTKLAPMAEEIKKKYANDKSELNKQLMTLYRKQGASPIMGFLPMFVQMPIWIALWSAVYTGIELRGKPFLPFWITDLSAPDALVRFSTVTVPLLGWKIESLNLLPILMGVAFYLQQKLTPQQAATASANPQVAQQQKMMMIMLPLLFPLMLYNAPSGVNLYIMASTFAGVIEQYVIRKHIREREEAESNGLVAVTSKTGGKVKKKKPKPFFRT